MNKIKRPLIFKDGAAIVHALQSGVIQGDAALAAVIDNHVAERESTIATQAAEIEALEAQVESARTEGMNTERSVNWTVADRREKEQAAEIARLRQNVAELCAALELSNSLLSGINEYDVPDEIAESYKATRVVSVPDIAKAKQACITIKDALSKARGESK